MLYKEGAKPEDTIIQNTVSLGNGGYLNNTPDMGKYGNIDASAQLLKLQTMQTSALSAAAFIVSYKQFRAMSHA